MQGFNMGRYVPPDVEGTISGNALNKKHPLGARASKLRTEGILTVRFEMPFGVWCSTCPKPTIIGQGVRFNAEKKKVGAYYSTPIWSFRMRHTDCGGIIEIRTDPANAEYVVTEGGKRRDTGEDKDDSLVTSSGGLLVGRVGGVGGEILTEKEKEALRKDAFARLEKTIEDRGTLIERSHRIAELEDASNRAWEDPYAQNRRLRAAFRVGRKKREEEAGTTEDLKERMSLGIDLLPATEEDARRAALVDFGVAAALGDSEEAEHAGDGAARTRRTRDVALRKPLFSSSATPNGPKTSGGSLAMSKHKSNSASPSTAQGDKGGSTRAKLKSEIKALKTRESLASEILGNTRASQDPFLVTLSEPRGNSGGITSRHTGTAPTRIQGIKRKRADPVATSDSSVTPCPENDQLGSDSDNTEGQVGKKEKRKANHQGDNIDHTLSGAPDDGTTVSASIPATILTDPSPPKTATGTALVEYDSD